MDSEKITLDNGYTVEVTQDTDARNPWKARDGEPPILVFNLCNGCVDDYETGLCLRDIFSLVPLEKFEGESLQKILDALQVDRSEFSPDDIPQEREDWKERLYDFFPDKPEGWGSAKKYFQTLETLCGMADIPCHLTTSNGYSQGDSALVFVAAMPEWVKLVGIASEHIAKSLEASCDLWGYWAWGNVYGIASISRPDGTELSEGSVWGFYGDDHKKSGLMESAEGSIAYDIRWMAKEAAERERAACADIMTV